MFKANIKNSSQHELLSCSFCDHVSPNINWLWLLLCYLRVRFQFASPPGFHLSTSRRGTSYVKKFEKRQLWVRPMGGWNSTLQAAWYVRYAHWARLRYFPFVIYMVFVDYIYDMVVDTQFHKFIGRSFVRVCKAKRNFYTGRSVVR